MPNLNDRKEQQRKKASDEGFIMTGALVGELEGDCVGENEGDEDGALDGESEGCCVGELLKTGFESPHVSHDNLHQILNSP